MEQEEDDWLDNLIDGCIDVYDSATTVFHEVLQNVFHMRLLYQIHMDTVPPLPEKVRTRICGAKTLKNGNCQRKVLHTEFCKSHENSPRIYKECVVCYEENVSKKTLCDHDVCFTCVQQIIKINKQPVCPMCRADL
jgi:hypothetical protein